MANLNKRLRHLEDIREALELIRWLRSLSDEALISYIKEGYRQLVNAERMEEENSQAFPSLGSELNDRSKAHKPFSAQRGSRE